MVQTEKKQTIKLPLAVGARVLDKDDLNIIRNKEIRSVAMRHQKLKELLKTVIATVYNQGSSELKVKLKSTENWEAIQKKQCIHLLIQKMKRICVRFDNHKQVVLNLVQVLRGLFLYTQSEKESVEEYGRNLKSLWDMVKASEGSLGLQKGMMGVLVKDMTKFADPSAPTEDGMDKVESQVNESVKAALLISRTDKH
jgi:hypothetical protein